MGGSVRCGEGADGGGGAGGLAHDREHLGDSEEGRWRRLGTPKLGPGLRAALIAGVEAEAQGKSIAQLEQERDAALMGILAARRRPVTDI